VNVFKPGTGTITIWENAAGKRGAQLYKLAKIPLTPGPLVVVIKVAQSQAFNASGPEPFWPPRVPDNIETIAASYVQKGTGGKVRLFNLSPDTKVAGMGITSGAAKTLATNVQYSLGSNWFPVPVTSQTYDFTDDLTKKVLTTRVETPPPNPLGFSNILIGLQKGSGTKVIQASAHALRLCVWFLSIGLLCDRFVRPGYSIGGRARGRRLQAVRERQT